MEDDSYKLLSCSLPLISGQKGKEIGPKYYLLGQKTAVLLDVMMARLQFLWLYASQALSLQIQHAKFASILQSLLYIKPT